jgi:hypothetical protein
MARFLDEQLNSPSGEVPPRHHPFKLNTGNGQSFVSGTLVTVSRILPTQWCSKRSRFSLLQNPSPPSVAINGYQRASGIKENMDAAWIQDHLYEHSPRGSHLCLAFQAHPSGTTFEPLRSCSGRTVDSVEDHISSGSISTDCAVGD